MATTTPYLSPVLQQWKQRLETDNRNPVKAGVLQQQLPSGIEVSAVYDAQSLGPEHAYLKAFHQNWKQQKSGWKIRLHMPSDPFAHFTSEKTAVAENLGLHAWSGEAAPAGHRLPVHNELAEDPITESLVHGHKTAGLQSLVKGTKPGILRINTVYFHHAGANEAEDLAYALCLAAHYRELLGEEVFARHAPSLVVHLAAGTDFFLEIARLRALRLLWMNFTAQCGLGKLAGHIQAETSRINWSKTDPDGNLLRHTSAAMSAVLGGADALLIHPHTLDPALAEDALRHSVDIGLLALEEARLKQTFDPGSGSYLMEVLTHELSRKAWQLFCDWQAIPLDGKLQSGFFIQIADKGAARMKADFREGSRVLTGVNRHPSGLSRPGPAYPGKTFSQSDFLRLKPVYLDA